MNLSRMQIQKPDDIEATMTITMTVAEWKAVREQLQQRDGRTFPGNFLCKHITALVDKLEAVLWAEQAKEE